MVPCVLSENSLSVLAACTDGPIVEKLQNSVDEEG